MTQTALIRKATIEELAGHRQRALELYSAAMDLIARANEAHNKAAPSYSFGAMFKLRGDASRSYENCTLEEITRDIDRRMWRSIMQATNLLGLMDAKERKEFEDQVDKNPPPATPENMAATCARLMDDADSIFRRGLVNAFARLCRDYKSNDGFKVGPKTVIAYAFSVYKYGNRCEIGYFNKDAEIADIDRAVHVLDGKLYERDSPTSLVQQLRNAKVDRTFSGFEAVTPYWKARAYLNGNLHLSFRDEDLRNRVNSMIAEHYGAALARPAA